VKGDPLRFDLKLHVALALPALAVAALAGCGGGGDNGKTTAPATSGAATTLRLTTDPSGQLRFDKKALDARAGRVTIVMKNPAPLSHNVSLEGSGINEIGKTVGQGGKSNVGADLKPGRYTFYCSVPGHREGGMVGTLTVK
jgi:plastocyanin